MNDTTTILTGDVAAALAAMQDQLDDLAAAVAAQQEAIDRLVAERRRH
jgi:hypothetical protein